VVKRIDAEEKTTGGIIIPDSAKEKAFAGPKSLGRPGRPRRGRQVIPIDLRLRPCAVRQDVGNEVKLDGQELLIMKESDIMASHRSAVQRRSRVSAARFPYPRIGVADVRRMRPQSKSIPQKPAGRAVFGSTG